METKTKTISKKAISIVLIVVLFSAQSALAQKQNVEAENSDPMHNLIFLVAALLFIVGFTVLFVLKQRDDNEKKPTQYKSPRVFTRHPNHYGHGHQYHR